MTTDLNVRIGGPCKLCGGRSHGGKCPDEVTTGLPKTVLDAIKQAVDDAKAPKLTMTLEAAFHRRLKRLVKNTKTQGPIMEAFREAEIEIALHKDKVITPSE